MSQKRDLREYLKKYRQTETGKLRIKIGCEKYELTEKAKATRQRQREELKRRRREKNETLKNKKKFKVVLEFLISKVQFMKNQYFT